MKRLQAFAILVVCLLPGLAGAQEKLKDFSVSLDIGSYSQYVGSIGCSQFTENSCNQFNLNVAHKSGWFVNFWQSLPQNTERDWHTFGRETDFSFGRNLGALSVSAGIYQLIPASCLYFINVALTGKTKVGIEPYAVLEHDFGHADLPSGTVYKAGLRGSAPGLPSSIPLKWDASLCGNMGGYGASQTDNLSAARLDLSLPVKLANGVLTPGVTLQQGLGHDPSHGGIAAGNRVIWYVGWGVRF